MSEATTSMLPGLDVIARSVHESNRVVQMSLGEEVAAPWTVAPDWMRESTINGVKGAIAGRSPEESHEAWMKERLAAGWTLGPVKDVRARISPCLVPYDDLPREQRLKDHLLTSIVNAYLDVYPELKILHAS